MTHVKAQPPTASETSTCLFHSTLANIVLSGKRKIEYFVHFGKFGPNELPKNNKGLIKLWFRRDLSISFSFVLALHDHDFILVCFFNFKRLYITALAFSVLNVYYFLVFLFGEALIEKLHFAPSNNCVFWNLNLIINKFTITRNIIFIDFQSEILMYSLLDRIFLINLKHVTSACIQKRSFLPFQI